MTGGGAFDPETIALLRAVLDGAWNSLNAQEQAQSSKTLLAERILHLAATGERGPSSIACRGTDASSYSFAPPATSASNRRVTRQGDDAWAAIPVAARAAHVAQRNAHGSLRVAGLHP